MCGRGEIITAIKAMIIAANVGKKLPKRYVLSTSTVDSTAFDLSPRTIRLG